MNNNKCALLVIDMQLVAFDGKITPPIPDGSHLLNNVTQLIDAFRTAGSPVVFFQACCAIPGQPYAQDAHGWELHPQVQPNADENVFHKIGPSGFENPGLDKFLKKVCVTELVICGIWSESCVASTCDSALQRGYKVLLIEDGHSTPRDSMAEALRVRQEQNEKLINKQAIVLNTQDTITRLRVG